MRVYSASMLVVGFSVLMNAQFTYFNSVHSGVNPSNPESVRNIELIDSGFVTWGVGFDIQDNLYYHFQKYSPDGTFETTIPYYFNPDFVWTGIINSFQRIPNSSDYFYAQAIAGMNGTEGFIMRADENLDTLWTRRLNIIPPYTYFDAHTWDGDEIAIVGRFDNGPGEAGALFAKLDSEGNYVWHQVIHEATEGAFLFSYISVLPTGFVVSGASGAGSSTEGRIEYLNEDGVLQWSLQGGGAAISRGIMAHKVAENGQILVAQSIAYEDYPFNPDPLYAYYKLRLRYLDIDSQSFYNDVEYFDTYEWQNAGVTKIVESADGGFVMVGPARIPDGEALHSRSFVMKVDTELTLEWYTELSYNPCDECFNQLYDIEVAQDGGYVMVGGFQNFSGNPNDMTWLVKVDACGDIEWQGCELPDGLWDTSTTLSDPLSIYPNPASDILNISVPEEFRSGEIRLVNVQGQTVLSHRFIDHFDSTLELDIEQLSSGFYSLVLSTPSGEIYTDKVVVE